MPGALTDHTHYQALGLQPDATDDDIRVAYKKLALKWHPDRHQDDKEEVQKRFVEIKEAYLKLVEARQRERKHKSRNTQLARSEAPTSSSTPASSSVPSSAPTSASAPSCATSESGSADSQTASAPTEKRGRKVSYSKKKSYRRPDALDNVELAPLKSPSQPAIKLARHEPSTFSHIRSEPDDISEEDEEILPKKPRGGHKSSRCLEDADYEFVDRIDLGSPLHPLERPQPKDSLSKDWVFSLPLSLEDLYSGASHHYRITRTLRSGDTQSVKIDIKISPSWRTGTRIRVSSVGNERRDGTFQDIVFVVEEKAHPMYTRVDHDLVIAVQVPWADPRTRPYPSSTDRRHRESDSSAYEDEEVYVRSMDGQEYALPIPRSLVEGADGTRITGAGMPVRERGKLLGHGDLIVKWEFVFPDSDKGHKWQSFKKAMHLRL